MAANCPSSLTAITVTAASFTAGTPRTETNPSPEDSSYTSTVVAIIVVEAWHRLQPLDSRPSFIDCTCPLPFTAVAAEATTRHSILASFVDSCQVDRIDLGVADNHITTITT